MKKFLALALCALMMLSVLTACGGNGGGSSTPAAPNTSSEGNNTPAPETPASDLNVGVFKYQNYDGANNQATQLDQINTAITNGANLLVVNIVETSSPDAAQQATNAAKNAGIPIVFFNREVADDVVNSYENCAFVGTDAPVAGHMQGEMIGDFLLANYDTVDLNGDGVISYVLFKGQEGNAEAEYRTQFAVEDANKKLVAAGKPELAFYNAGNADKYLVDQTGGWSAQAATDYMNTILAEYSEANKNMVELVIANNDGMAEGAVAALQAAGYNLGKETPDSKVIPVYGVDAMDSAVQKINDGQMTGTVKQDGDGMAETIVTLVKNINDGGALMDNTSSMNVDDGVAKIRVPYAKISA